MLCSLNYYIVLSFCIYQGVLCISPPRGYIVNTPQCKIPSIEVYSDEARRFTRPVGYKPCTTLELLTEVKKSNDGTSAYLQLKQNVIASYVNNTENLECCYSEVRRRDSDLDEGNPDDEIEISNCIPFRYTENVTIGSNDPVIVKCGLRSNDTEESLVYENVHSSVLITEGIKKKTESIPVEAKPISVLLVVCDSISRLNLIRTMRNTYDYLKDNEFIEMLGYSKIHDNTYPNFMALLTGLSLGQNYKACNRSEADGLNKCPMIWYDYRNLGYATAYAEDDFAIATFNYNLLRGFKYPPTDYYFRAHVGAAESLRIEGLGYAPYCTGPETSGERILGLAKDFSATFKGKPSFGVFWMNTFSHNHVNLPYTMDLKMKQFFEELKSGGTLDDSIVVFLADHGMRFGQARATKTGWFEERLPMNLISIPKWFREKFPDEYEALQYNSDKFTSTFDLYMTLQHILTLSGLNSTNEHAKGCPKCQSLFKPVPLDRNCSEAGVPAEWCTCVGHLDPSGLEDVYIKNATDVVVDYLNELVEKDAPGLCEHIEFSKILNASISEVISYTDKRSIYLNVETIPLRSYLVTVVFDGVVTKETIDTIFVHNKGCVKKSIPPVLNKIFYKLTNNAGSV